VYNEYVFTVKGEWKCNSKTPKVVGVGLLGLAEESFCFIAVKDGSLL
jgi:hypothetical protein